MPTKQRLEAIGKIRKTHPGEWILIADYVSDRLNRPVKGRLVAHSRRRRDIDRSLAKCSGRLRVEYTGRIPADVEVVLHGQV